MPRGADEREAARRAEKGVTDDGQAALKKKGIFDMIEEARKADADGAGSATGGGKR